MTTFQKQLKQAENPEAAAVLDQFYRQFLNAYKIERVSYETQLERSLQHAGVDTMLFVIAGGIMNIEEKICLHPLAKYFFLEFQTHGHDGWAIDPRKHSDLIVFLYRNFIYAFNYDDFRDFCATNKQLLLHDVGVSVTYNGSDDANLCAKVPIDIFLELYAATGNDFIKEAVAV